MEEVLKYFKRRLKHAEKRLKDFENSHNGVEDKLTYHAGCNKGYWLGRARAIEDIIDKLEESCL